MEGAALVLAFWDDAEAAAAEEELEAAALLLALWDDADAEAAAAEELELEDAVFFLDVKSLSWRQRQPPRRSWRRRDYRCCCSRKSQKDALELEEAGSALVWVMRS